MKLTTLMLVALLVQASAASRAQKLTLRADKVSLERLFLEVRKQTGYNVLVNNTEISTARKIAVDFREAPLKEVLDRVVEGTGLEYAIEERTIILRMRERNLLERLIDRLAQIEVRGRVADSEGRPLSGASLLVRGTRISTVSGEDGSFVLKGVEERAVLVVSYLGYVSRELAVRADMGEIRLIAADSKLDEVQVIAYGTTTRRLSTGNVGTVKGEDISRQPIANPLAALQGRVPGLIVTQSSGLPGAAFKVQLRGQSSIGILSGELPPNDPLFIIDGVPFAANNSRINTTATAAGNLSPLSAINPADIESIDVLKDADATAIYGSRGANGVILITTKKGAAGKTVVSANVYSGASVPASQADWLTTRQYVALRKEAIANDGDVLNATTAPDLFLLDTTRYTNYREALLGGAAPIVDAQVTLKGGSQSTQFLIGGAFRREGTVFPANFSNNRGSAHLSLNHASSDQRFSLGFSALYSVAQDNSLTNDLSRYLNTLPNAPESFAPDGRLNWTQNGYTFDNPFAYTQKTVQQRTENFLANAVLSYRIVPGLTFRANLGYNITRGDGSSLNPLASKNPDLVGATASASYGSNSFRNWVAEPQLEYARPLGRGRLNVILGSTLLSQHTRENSISAEGYASDALIGSLGSAGLLTVSDYASQFNYEAVFARATYNFRDRYVLNLTGRRDGSSRFGPSNRFGSFGALGAAWIFTNEDFLKGLPVLSFGKLRASYGVTGNDQIGDYKYLDSWTGTTYKYNGVSGLRPTQLTDSTFRWELNKKLEVGLELGLFKDRLFVSGSFYRNRSSNQLVAYRTPIQVGFSTIAAKNFPAIVQNQGLEIALQGKAIKGRTFSWDAALNLTFPSNKLIAFPNLANSSYASSLIVGQSLNVLQRYHYMGVDPTSGLFTFQDLDGDGAIGSGDNILKSRDPKYYGGLQNTFGYGNFKLDVFLQYVHQDGYNYLNSIYRNDQGPGFRYNQVTDILDKYWRAPGQVAELQKLTAKTGTPAYAAINNFLGSDGIFTNASFLKVRTVSLSYTLAGSLAQRIGASSVRLYLQGQNLFTITSYAHGDPETQDLKALAPLRTFTAGLQLTL